MLKNGYIDISLALNEKTVVWIEDNPPEFKPVCRRPEAPCNFTWLNFGAHAGTHIDAPYYLYSNQWTCDQVPLERLCGPCQVLDLTHVDDTIEVSDLTPLKITESIVLLKTKNSYDPMVKFNMQFIALSVPAAEYLKKKGVTTLGYDYLTFERNGANDVHDVFLKDNITLIDNLRLKDTQAKKYTLMCLPIKITGIDAAPVRAILLEDSDV